MTSFLCKVLIIALIIIFQLASKKKFNLRKIRWPTKEPTKTRSKTRTETSNLTYILLYCDTSELGLFLLVLDPTSVFSELLSLSITNLKKKKKINFQSLLEYERNLNLEARGPGYMDSYLSFVTSELEVLENISHLPSLYLFIPKSTMFHRVSYIYWDRYFRRGLNLILTLKYYHYISNILNYFLFLTSTFLWERNRLKCHREIWVNFS